MVQDIRNVRGLRIDRSVTRSGNGYGYRVSLDLKWSEREREKRDLTVEETRTGKWNTVAAERGLKSTPLMGSFWVSKLNARESA